MSTKTTTSRDSQLAADQKLIDGLTKHSSTLSSLVIGGQSYTTAAVIGLLQGRIATSTSATNAHSTWQAAVQADREQQAKTKTFVSGLRKALQVAYAGSIDSLADFGLKAPKPRTPLTPAQKAAAVAKAEATRAARHTMGPKQKAAIKGTVPAAAPETQPAPAAPAPQASPAPGTTAPTKS